MQDESSVIYQEESFNSLKKVILDGDYEEASRVIQNDTKMNQEVKETLFSLLIESKYIELLLEGKHKEAINYLKSFNNSQIQSIASYFTKYCKKIIIK